MSFGEDSTRTDRPNFPLQRFLTKAILTARKSRQRRTKCWVGLKMDLKKFWPDFLSVKTFPPKSQCGVLDLSVLFFVTYRSCWSARFLGWPGCTLPARAGRQTTAPAYLRIGGKGLRSRVSQICPSVSCLSVSLRLFGAFCLVCSQTRRYPFFAYFLCPGHHGENCRS